MEAQASVADKGGTMRLGTYACALKEGTKARELYGAGPHPGAPPPPLRGQQRLPRPAARRPGWWSPASNPDLDLVEMIELNNHPYFVGCQFHPEFKSKPFQPHPLFAGFIAAALRHRDAAARAESEPRSLAAGQGRAP